MQRKDWASIKAIAFDAYGTIVRLNGRLVQPEQGPGDNRPRRDALRDAMTRADRSGSADLGSLIAPEVPNVTSCPDALDALRTLALRGYQVGVASNLAPEYAAPVVKYVKPFVSTYCWSFELGVLKPDPRFFLALCESLGRRPCEVLMVGNSYRQDYRGAIDAGLHALWLPPNEHERQQALTSLVISLT